MTIGQKIKFLRKLFNPKVKQEVIAELAFGKNEGAQKVMSRIETGTQEPRFSELKALAITLSIRVEDFFSDSIDPRVIDRLSKSKPRKVAD